MAVPRYRVTLTPEERKQSTALTRAATKTTGKRFLYARGWSRCPVRGVLSSIARCPLLRDTLRLET